jgi:hypothetical protein
MFTKYFTYLKSGAFGYQVLVFLILISLIMPYGLSRVSATINVLYAKPEVSGNGDCSSWDDACTLQTALTNAVSDDQIWVMAGRHIPAINGDRGDSFQLKDGVSVYGGFNGTETSLDQRDWLTHTTILSGDLNGNDVGFLNNDENSYNVVKGATGGILDGFTISGGNANIDTLHQYGGGMLNTSTSSPLVSNAIFSGNFALRGAGMTNLYGSSPLLTNVTFTNNQTYIYGCGGGMFNQYSSNPVLTNVNFNNNMSDCAAGILNSGSSGSILNNVTFEQNTTYPNGGGGGIIVDWDSEALLNNVTFSHNSGGMIADGDVTLNNVTFISNTVNSGGAGMSIGIYSQVELNDVYFIGNSAGYGSGGIYAVGGELWLENVSFINNSGGSAGGLLSTSGTELQLKNVTFNNNSSGGYGGGLTSLESSVVTLTNVTVYGNTAVWGGGIYCGNSTFTITNLTMSSNHENTASGGMSNSGCNTTIENSILWGDGEREFWNDTTSNVSVTYSIIQGGYEGAGNLDVEPLLAPLGDYGGGVETIALLPNSPAIDATSSNCPDTDARGITRSSPSCDSGAFESQGFSLSKTGGDNQNTPIYSNFSEPLCASVTAKNLIEPVDGGQISFTAPASGPSATILNSPATLIDAIACSTARANGTIGGPYEVSGNASGASATIFNLTNIPGPGMATFLPITQKPEGCSVGFSLEDPANDVSPAYIDVVFFNSSRSGDSLAATFTLRDIPEKLTFNRYGLPQYTTEYDWAVYINVDNSTDTGSPYLGIDYLLDASAFVHQPNNPIELPIESGVWAIVWEFEPPSSFGAIATARLTIDRQSHTLQLVGNIPGLTGKSRLIFWTYDANPGGSSQEDASKCGFDNPSMDSGLLLPTLYQLNDFLTLFNK